jgi:hypothetical protein
MRIVVMLCHYRRDTLKEQISAIKRQSVQTEIIIWNNSGKRLETELSVISPKDNVGVWSRFTYLRDVFADFYAVIDDDTIPAPKWLEYCIQGYNVSPRVYCSSGFVFDKYIQKLSLNNFNNRVQHGWINPSKNEVKVDWPGHSWFFDRNVLLASLGTERAPHFTSGEDAHLAFCAQKIGQDCFVSSYHRPEFHGSIRGKIGQDEHATWRMADQKMRMIDSLNFYRDRGWKWVND